MKWEKIKENAIAELLHKVNTPFDPMLVGLIGLESVKRIVEQRQTTFKTLKMELEVSIKEIVNSVDVRSYKQLLAIAPKAFPACARNGKASVELTDNGWEILPTVENI